MSEAKALVLRLLVSLPAWGAAGRDLNESKGEEIKDQCP